MLAPAAATIGPTACKLYVSYEIESDIFVPATPTFLGRSCRSDLKNQYSVRGWLRGPPVPRLAAFVLRFVQLPGAGLAPWPWSGGRKPRAPTCVRPCFPPLHQVPPPVEISKGGAAPTAQAGQCAAGLRWWRHRGGSHGPRTKRPIGLRSKSSRCLRCVSAAHS